MSSIINCIEKLLKAGQIDEPTAAKAKRLYEAAQAGVAADMGESGASAVAALKTAEAMSEAALNRQYQASLNALAIDRNVDRVAADPHSRALGAVRLFAPLEAPGGRVTGKNVQGMTELFEAKIAKPFSEAIEKYRSRLVGLTKDLEGPRNAVRELFGVHTGDEVARAAAAGWKAGNDIAVDLAKAKGKVFAPNEDWRLPQFWSTVRARAFGRDEFKSDIMTEIRNGGLIVRDPQNNGAAASGERLQQIVDGASQKIWLGTGESTGYGSPGSFSPDMRIFKFADGQAGADAWLRLQGKYGVGQDLMQALQGHIHHQARELALMDVFGPSHRAGFDAVKDAVREETAENGLKKPGVIAQIKAFSLSDVSPAAIGRAFANAQTKIFASEHGLNRLYRTATGEADAVAGQFWSGIFGALKHGSIAGQMGSATVSSIAPDSWTAVLAARANGIPAAQILSRIMKEFAAGGEDSRALVAQMAVVSHGSIDAALNASRYADEGSVAGAMSKVSNIVIRASGLQAWDEALKRAFTMEFMGMVGRQSGKALDDVSMNPYFRGFLERNKFTTEEWDHIRAGDHLDMDGAKFFDPDSIGRQDISERFKNAFLDERRYASPQAGLLERSIVADMKRGTFFGELGRSMMMYKTFPMWVLLTHVQRAAVQMGEGKGGYMAQLVLGLTFAGMASLQAKDLLQGKDPRPMNQWQTWLAAAAQGGGGGIYGDFLKSAFDRQQGSLAEAAIGPAAGLVSNVAKLVSSNARSAVDGTPDHWQGQLVQFLKSYTPGSNLWYSRLATDRLVWDQIQKMVDPQWGQSFSRVRDKAMKDWNQGFYWDKGALAPSRVPNLGRALGN